MDSTNGLKEITRVTAAVASNTLGVNVFTAPGKTMVGERPRPFGEAFGFDPITSTLIFGEYDAVLVDAMEVLQGRMKRSDTLAVHAAITTSTVQGTTFRSRNNPSVCPLVSPIWP